MAHYDAAATTSTNATVPPTAPSVGPPTAGPGPGESTDVVGSRSATGTDTPAIPAPQTPIGNQPALGSSVTWSNRTGSVTGGGLIAGYCCAGPAMAVYANRPVGAGRHYWELTLSVEPGHSNPSSYTTAGVAAADQAGSSSVDYVTSALVGTKNPNADRYAVAIRWGEASHYQNGDVFMFALDAARGELAYGVNGQWLSGDPRSSSAGMTVHPSTAGLVAFAGLSASHGKPEGDRWIANFGAAPFKYPAPAGYSGYGGSGGTAATPPATQSVLASTKRFPPSDPASLIGKVFQNEVTVGGQGVPLPDGPWTALAFFRESPGSGQGDAMVLGRLENGRVLQLAAINAFRHAGATRAGFPRFAACDRQDYLFVSKTSNEAFGEQKCWWVNHNEGVWQQSIFRAARGVLNDMNVSTPDTLVNVAIHRANTEGFLTVFYLFDPATEGFASTQGSWRDSEWAKERLAADPRRSKYVDQLTEWGKSWAPVVYAYRMHPN
jgi:hypothetical protein